MRANEMRTALTCMLDRRVKALLTEDDQYTDRSLRVLHLLTSVTGAGCGIVNAAMDIIAGQLNQGIDIAVCAGEGEFSSLLSEYGIPFHVLDQRRTITNLPRAVSGLRKIIRTFQPDVVHCHMMTSLLLARLIRRSTPFAIVAHLHNVHQRSSNLMGLADCVIAVSEAVRHDMIRRGIPPTKLTVVHNGMIGSLRFRPPVMQSAIDLCQPAIVTVGGMNHRKGISDLISAFDKMSVTVPNHHLYLVGDGPNAAEFRAQAANSRFHKQIHFAGFQQNPIPFMKAAALFVLASRRESFGLVLTEARQCGCAIVATDVDGIPEALDQGKAGLLVAPNDISALVKGMSEVLTNDVLKHDLQQRAQLNLERFTVERMAAEIRKVYGVALRS